MDDDMMFWKSFAMSMGWRLMGWTGQHRATFDTCDGFTLTITDTQKTGIENAMKNYAEAYVDAWATEGHH